jgi:DNA polymerase III gamma/tau subunit
LVSKLVEQGVDMKYFIEQLINTLHSFLLHKVGVESKEEFSIFNFQFSIEETKRLVELLAKAHAELKYAVLPQIPLELAIVEWGLVR